MTFHSNEDNPQLMKLKDVCEMLKISRATVYRWVEEGKFPEPVDQGVIAKFKRIKHLGVRLKCYFRPAPVRPSHFRKRPCRKAPLIMLFKYVSVLLNLKVKPF